MEETFYFRENINRYYDHNADFICIIVIFVFQQGNESDRR